METLKIKGKLANPVKIIPEDGGLLEIIFKVKDENNELKFFFDYIEENNQLKNDYASIKANTPIEVEYLKCFRSVGYHDQLNYNQIWSVKFLQKI